MEYISNPFVISWLVLGGFVAALAVYRKFLANREDDMLHLVSGVSKIGSQVDLAQRLNKIDFWGKTLTIVLAAYGAALFGIFTYRAYVAYYTPVG